MLINKCELLKYAQAVHDYLKSSAARKYYPHRAIHTSTLLHFHFQTLPNPRWRPINLVSCEFERTIITSQILSTVLAVVNVTVPLLDEPYCITSASASLNLNFLSW